MKHRRQRRLFLRFRDHRDYDALTQLFDATAPSLLALASHLVREVDTAEDLVQSTYLVAIERAQAYDAERDVYPWLAGILVNKARQWNRRTDRSVDPDRLVERAGEPDPVVAAGGLEVSAALHGALEELPDTYRHVLVPYLEEGEQPRSIAEKLGIAPGTARVRIHRGLDMLRKALPAGFAAGGLAALLPLRGLDYVRATVLQQARISGEGAVVVAGGTAVAAGLQALQLAGIAAGLAFASGAAWMLAGKVQEEDTAGMEALEPLVESLEPPEAPPIEPPRVRDEVPVVREPESAPVTARTPDAEPIANETSAVPEQREPAAATLLGWSLRPWTDAVPPGHVKVSGAAAAIGSKERDVADILKKRSDGATIAGRLHAETPRHKVELDDFHMLRTEVTVEQYLAYLVDVGQIGAERSERTQRDYSSLQPRFLEPMATMTFDQVRGYAAWAGLRLPSEFEWEHAARGKSKDTYPWGDRADRMRAATIGHPLGPGLVPVASYPDDVTRDGLFDMVGNVAEWTSSPYTPYPKFKPERYRVGRRGPMTEALPQFGAGGRVVKGGSFRDDAVLARATCRRPESPDLSSDTIGFRTAASPTPGRDAAAHALASCGREDEFDLERVIGIDRWWVRSQLGLVGPEGYEVIAGYDHVAFVPVHKLSTAEVWRIVEGEQSEPVLIGLLTTDQPILFPALGPGSYLARLVRDPAGTWIELIGVEGGESGRVPAPMVHPSGKWRPGEHKLLVRGRGELRIGVGIRAERGEGGTELNFGIGLEPGPWRE